jgi:hypothetical protein
MPWVGFEPTILVYERAKTFRALDRAATVIGILYTRTYIEIINLLYEVSLQTQAAQSYSSG